MAQAAQVRTSATAEKAPAPHQKQPAQTYSAAASLANLQSTAGNQALQSLVSGAVGFVNDEMAMRKAANRDAERIKALLQKGRKLSPGDEDEVFVTIATWAEQPFEPNAAKTPLDYLVYALRGATFTVEIGEVWGTKLIGPTSAYDELYKRASPGKVAWLSQVIPLKARSYVLWRIAAAKTNEAEAEQDAQRIRRILQDNWYLSDSDDAAIMNIVEDWGARHIEPDVRITPFDRLVAGLRRATYYIGTIVEQMTSAFDQMHERMSKRNVARFRELMKTRGRLFNDEQPIESVKFEVTKEDVVEGVATGVELAAAVGSGGTSVLVQIGLWLATTLPKLYSTAKTVIGFVDKIKNINLDEVKKLLSPVGFANLITGLLFGEVSGLPTIGKAEEEGEEKEGREDSGGREAKGLVKVFRAMVRIFGAVKKVYNHIASVVDKSLAYLNMTTKAWFAKFAAAYAAIVKVVEVVTDPSSIVEAVASLKANVGDFFKGIKDKVKETTEKVKAGLSILGKPAELLKLLADRAVEMVLNFIITHPPSRVVKIAFKVVEAGAGGKSITQLVRENVPLADKIIEKIAASDTVQGLMEPLKPAAASVGEVVDKVAGEAGAVTDQAETKAMGLLANGQQLVAELVGVSPEVGGGAGEPGGAGADGQAKAGTEPAAAPTDFFGALKYGLHTRLMKFGLASLAEMAKGAASKIKGKVLGAVLGFFVNGERHQAWVEQRGNVAVGMMASEPDTWEAKAIRYESSLGDLEGEEKSKASKAITELRGLAKDLRALDPKKDKAKVNGLVKKATDKGGPLATLEGLISFDDVEPIDYKAAAKEEDDDEVKDSDISLDYKGTFFAKHPKLKGKVVVHHSIERQVIRRTTGLFGVGEINKYEFLRGIPKAVNSDVHLSRIRTAWDAFYGLVFGAAYKKRKKVPKKTNAPKASPEKQKKVRGMMENKRDELDRQYGSKFDPPK